MPAAPQAGQTAITSHYSLGQSFTGFHEPVTGMFGGANRDRTDDLYNAIVALSQLSYGPLSKQIPALHIQGIYEMQGKSDAGP